LIDHSFWFYSSAFFGVIMARYFLVAGLTYWFFYSFRCQPETNAKLSHTSRRSIQRDIKLSILSAIVFALAAAFVMAAYGWGITRLYSQLQQYGIWYIGASYVAVLILQDTYFYFTHRLFHHPALFAWLHQGHHHSRHPTPWTSFAFDPLEAIGQALFLVGIMFVMPLHFVTVLALLTTMTIWAVVNHLGIERLPSSFPHHWLGRWVIGPAHHSIHHLNYTVHYGLYFTFWDNLLATTDPNYPQRIKLPQIIY
jgi:Delta7-sterol 5-desaturase